MGDIKFIQSVINAEIDFNKSFNIERIKYDTYNPFEKYYSFETISKVVNKLDLLLK